MSRAPGRWGEPAAVDWRSPAHHPTKGGKRGMASTERVRALTSPGRKVACTGTGVVSHRFGRRVKQGACETAL